MSNKAVVKGRERKFITWHRHHRKRQKKHFSPSSGYRQEL
jgi:hypothetical protein